MFNIGDIVLVHDGVNDAMECRVVDFGPDESGVIWYSCTPVDFYFPREFTEDRLTAR